MLEGSHRIPLILQEFHGIVIGGGGDSGFFKTYKRVSGLLW